MADPLAQNPIIHAMIVKEQRDDLRSADLSLVRNVLIFEPLVANVPAPYTKLAQFRYVLNKPFSGGEDIESIR